MLSRKCCMFLHTAPLLYFPTVLLVSCLFVGVLPQGFGGFLSLFSFTFRNFGFMQEFSASSDSGKPPHYSHFCVLATHTYILNQFLCQNLYSLFSCSSSTLPFTTAALKLLERLQNPLTNILKTETILKSAPAHLKKKSATLILFQTALVAVFQHLLCI